MPWHIEQKGEQHCVIKDSTGENEGCHPTAQEAKDHMSALYANEYKARERLFIENDSFVTLIPGKPIRLFPFGKLTRAGKIIEFTKELAAKMRLPGYKPAIKLGNHDDTTASGGYIEDLTVGEDGLYAVPSFTEKGIKAVEEGDYRYHSPEVIWDGQLEDVTQEGGFIAGPLITGLALLHDPALGAAAALYQVTPISNKEQKMDTQVLEQIQEENKSFLAKLGDFFTAKKGEAIEAEKFVALQAERDDLAAKLETQDAERKQAELYAAVKAEFDTDEFGAAYKGMAVSDEDMKMMATMDEEHRAWANKKMRAMSKQIDESVLLAEKGKQGDAKPVEGADAVDAKVKAFMAEKKITNYNEAVSALLKEQPDLYKEIK